MAHYTASGNWRPSIPNQTCAQCGVNFTAHKRDQRFCGRVCARRSRPTIAKTERTCPGCGVKWLGWPSNPDKYCSKACLFESGEWSAPRDAECEHCGATFKSRRRRHRGDDEWQKFCSQECAKAPRLLETRSCCSCGKDFEVNVHREDRACSWECRTEFYTRERSATWNGGTYFTGEVKRVRLDRPGYAAKYEADYRIIAGRAIGRPLMRGEVVLHIDKDNSNDAEFNLFVCASMSEFARRRNGSLPWPTLSNLSTYYRDGYDYTKAA